MSITNSGNVSNDVDAEQDSIFFKFKKNIHNSRHMHAEHAYFLFIIITWLNVGLLCIREHRSPWRHAPILK